MALGTRELFYGGDWNPEQWPWQTVQEDVELFLQAGINLVTINVFGWTMVQPEEDVYNFEYLDRVIALAKERGLKICLATGTAAHPAWMAVKYPDVLRTDFQGRRRRFGDRHNSCPSSPSYQRLAAGLVRALVEHYVDESSVVLWHISNELMGTCYCENCQNRFRQWLKNQYASLDALNAAWNTRFWNQYVTSWDQIFLPNALTVQWGDRETAMPALTLDYNRFNSWNLLQMYLLEYQIIKEILPQAQVTTNFMGPYRPLDYRLFAPYLDVVSWDSYPSMDTPPEHTAFFHSLMRGLKPGKPFLLMEQTPSQTNWQPHNSLKRPGVMALQSLQAIGHGSDSVLFFQMRRSRGGCEKFHGAVIEHSGRSDVRVFREVAALGDELRSWGSQVVGSLIPRKAALIFDWNCWWASENSMGPNRDLNYLDFLRDLYAAFARRGVNLEVVGPEAELDGYSLVLAPLLFLTEPQTVDRLSAYVDKGGILFSTCLTGFVDHSDLVFPGGAPGPLRELFGLWVEETDALPADRTNRILGSGNSLGASSGASGSGRSGSGRVPTADINQQSGLLPTQGLECWGVFDILRLETAQPVGWYQSEFYAQTPALTQNSYGKGQAWYLASLPSQGAMDDLARMLCGISGLHGLLPEAPVGCEVLERRTIEGNRILFLLNHTNEPMEVSMGSDSLKVLGASTGSGLTAETSAHRPTDKKAAFAGPEAKITLSGTGWIVGLG